MKDTLDLVEAKIVNEAQLGRESSQHYIDYLKRNYQLDRRVKSFLINRIYDKLYPDRDRVIVEIENLEGIPLKLRIDSQPRHCNTCGKDAYYIMYNMPYLPNMGWRVCFRHLSPQARAMLAEYYWNYRRI